MSADRLADVVAVGAADPAHLSRLAERLPRGDGWRSVPCPPGWCAAMKTVGGGDPDTRMPLVLEGWPALNRWGGDEQGGHERLRAAAAAKRWGSVPGDVSYVDLQPEGKAALVRAPAARVPIYVDSREGIRLATRMDLLLALRPEWPWQIDPFIALAWASAHGVYPEGRTPIKGVRLLLNGYATSVDVSREHVASTRYWDPRAVERPVHYDADEHAARLRELVLDSLRTELDPGGRNVLKLSLGTDSCTLAVATKRVLGIDYEAISYLPTNAIDRAQEEGFRQTLNDVAAPARHVRRHLDSEEWNEVLAQEGRGGLPILDPTLIDLPVFHDDVRVLLGGEWADAVCGDQITLADWLAEARLRAVLTQFNGLGIGEKELLWSLWYRLTRRLPLGSQVPAPRQLLALARDEVAAEALAWSDELLREAREQPYRRARLFHELRADLWTLQNWEVLSGLGVRRVTPFYRREMIELAFTAPVEGLIGPGVKKPLRRGFANDVPAALLWRPKSYWRNEPKPVALPWERELPSELGPILRLEELSDRSVRLDSGTRFALSVLEGYISRLRALKARVSTDRS